MALTVLKKAFFALKFALVDSLEEDLARLDARFFLSVSQVTSSSETPCLFITEQSCELIFLKIR